MHNPGYDNELDQFSREAAANYRVPGSPDWAAMEKKLDIAMPAEKKKRRYLFWWIVPVILAAGAVYWLTGHFYDQQSNTIAALSASAKNNTKATLKPITSAKSLTAAEQVSSGEPQQVITAADNTGKMIRPMSGHAGSARTYTAPVASIAERIADPQASATGREDVPASPPAEEAIKPTTKNSKPAVIPVTDSSTTAHNSIAVTRTDLTGFDKGWSVSLIAGTDLSTVRFTHADQPGINIGILAGYHFNRKWSLHTGAVYTQKNYTVSGTDFTAPKGSWVSYYKLETVEGFCRMFEVPLMARYVLPVGSHKDQYYISTGLSSYFMTKENYDYYYYNMQGRPMNRNASYPAGDTYILSILHLSAAFEHRLGRALCLQVEPYAKIPLTGLGFGQIQLSSFGLNFGLQLRQPKSK